jgi:hypothetical protein
VFYIAGANSLNSDEIQEIAGNDAQGKEIVVVQPREVTGEYGPRTEERDEALRRAAFDNKNAILVWDTANDSGEDATA